MKNEKQYSNEDKFFELINDSPIEVHLLNLDSYNYSYMNKAALENLDYNEYEYKSLTPENIELDMLIKNIDKVILPILEDKKNHIVKRATQIRRDGTSYPVESHLSLIEYKNQNHLVVMAINISYRNSIENELAIQREISKNFFSSSVDAMFITKDEQIIDINKTALDMFGYKEDEILLLTLKDLFKQPICGNELNSEGIIKDLLNCLQNGKNRFEYSFNTVNAEDLWVDIVVTELKFENEELLHFVLRDITKSKNEQSVIALQQNQLTVANEALNTRYEDELRLRQELEFYKTELEKQVEIEVLKNREKDHLLHNQARSAQMGEMISMIAHQWRQPLNSLSASAIGLSMKGEVGEVTSEDISSHIKFVENSTQQMSQTINDFMDFFKPEEEARPFSVHELLNDTFSLISSQLKIRGIELRYDRNLNITITGHRKELSHVLINLISNSRDAYESIDVKEKYIDINFIDSDKFVKIILKDYAGGIPNENMDKIFNPYFTTKEQGKGTGIGLFMSKKIILEVFNGMIDFENTSDGVSFLITIPK